MITDYGLKEAAQILANGLVSASTNISSAMYNLAQSNRELAQSNRTFAKELNSDV